MNYIPTYTYGPTRVCGHPYNFDAHAYYIYMCIELCVLVGKDRKKERTRFVYI